MKKHFYLLAGLVFFSTSMSAQYLREGYINSGQNVSSEKFTSLLNGWKANKKISEDDNFYISRVKPKKRFTNTATQVKKNLTKENDKRLIMWVPWDDPHKNALPDGKFDSEVFSMWNYVSHFGDWSAPLGRIPANLLDVAHKNGVAVSGVAGIPFGSLRNEYANMLNNLSQSDVKDVAAFLRYYGIDGLGYNSEFSGGSWFMSNLQEFHKNLAAEMGKQNPVYENIWYDGTDNDGNLSFDKGLGDFNDQNFGEDQAAASLFFNYNWNGGNLLENSVAYAKEINRDPLYLYAGINMQGGEPRWVGNGRWTLLEKYPISIGLWGAHTRNMFWESRNEKGSNPETMQRSYLLRTERWFTGGTRNPANCPPVGNSLNYGVDNYDFQGMSPFMTAKSTLCWDLNDEAFITYFNLGNGRFFNWNGVRCHNSEWANVGVQDYLPTWHFWFSSKLLSGEKADVPTKGLDAEFTWKDAYVGGSCLRIFGSTNSEYLHLFKTKYGLKAGDVVTIRYKAIGGKSNVKLVLTATGSETQETAYGLRTIDELPNADEWLTKTFTVTNDLAGKELALIALKFENAENLNLYLGECSIVRGKAETPSMPKIISSKLFDYNASGLDAKLIFNMNSNKADEEPVYNSDVKTSLFKVYAQQEGGEKVLMGITTSWAAMMYAIPLTIDNAKIRLGVSAVSLDMKSESEIAWTEYQDLPEYKYSEAIQLNKPVIKPNEDFEISYVDPKHAEGTWEVLDASGKSVFKATGNAVKVENGLSKEGTYDIKLTDAKGIVHEYPGYIQITSLDKGALPKIVSLTANGSKTDISVEENAAVAMAYTGRQADGILSRGLKIEEAGVGFKTNAAGFTQANFATKEWTLSFWIKFNSIPNEMQILDLRAQESGWPWNNWGTFWSQYDAKNKDLCFTLRERFNHGVPEHSTHWKVNFIPQTWTHVTFVMESNGTGIREKVYVNGKLADATKWNVGSGQSGTGMNPQYFVTTNSYMEDGDHTMMMIGKGRHQLAAIDGVVDDVKFFDKKLDDKQIATLMYDNKNTIAPTLFWDFESNADGDGWISAKEGNVKFMTIGSKPGSKEGVQILAPKAPTFDAGCFFSAGNSFKLETKPEWATNLGLITNVTGSDKTGSAAVTYPAHGDYKVTLTLENSFGKDTKTFQVIHVSTKNGIQGTTASKTKAYVVGDEIYVECVEAGNYKFSVYSVNGNQIISKALTVANGNTVKLQLCNTGIYILKVQKDGKTIRTVKLIRQ